MAQLPWWSWPCMAVLLSLCVARPEHCAFSLQPLLRATCILYTHGPHTHTHTDIQLFFIYPTQCYTCLNFPDSNNLSQRCQCEKQFFSSARDSLVVVIQVGFEVASKNVNAQKIYIYKCSKVSKKVIKLGQREKY